MLFISTDYLFDGQGDSPWNTDCGDYAPINVYGQSKLDGELAVKELLEKYFIVRTAWIFGRNGNNFVKTMLELSESHEEIRVVNDTRSGRRPIPTIWRGCSWISQRRKSMAFTMPRTKVGIFLGMISPAKYTGRREGTQE